MRSDEFPRIARYSADKINETPRDVQLLFQFYKTEEEAREAKQTQKFVFTPPTPSQRTWFQVYQVNG